MKTINIITAVLLSIKSFGATPFSIHNITCDIRDNVDMLKYTLEDIGDSVYHDEVRNAFFELYDNELLENYTRSYNAGGYYEHQLVVDSNIPISSTPVVSTTIPNIEAISRASTIPKDVQKKMYVYLKNNGEVTMKQIQSRLKGHSYTCKEIKDFLAQLQLIDPQTTSLPDSQVKTCNISIFKH